MTKKSVCHTSYLINHTSYNCHLWYTSVKWQYLQAFFHFLKILIFRVVKRAKEQKTVGWWKGKKWSKMTKNSVLYTSYLRNHASYDCHLWYTCKFIISPGYFFNFFLTLIFWVRGAKVQKVAQNHKKIMSIIFHICWNHTS